MILDVIDGDYITGILVKFLTDTSTNPFRLTVGTYRAGGILAIFQHLFRNDERYNSRSAWVRLQDIYVDADPANDDFLTWWSANLGLPCPIKKIDIHANYLIVSLHGKVITAVVSTSSFCLIKPESRNQSGLVFSWAADEDDRPSPANLKKAFLQPTNLMTRDLRRQIDPWRQLSGATHIPTNRQFDTLQMTGLLTKTLGSQLAVKCYIVDGNAFVLALHQVVPDKENRITVCTFGPGQLWRFLTKEHKDQFVKIHLTHGLQKLLDDDRVENDLKHKMKKGGGHHKFMIVCGAGGSYKYIFWSTSSINSYPGMGNKRCQLGVVLEGASGSLMQIANVLTGNLVNRVPDMLREADHLELFCAAERK
jgi:hypothetical protein